MNDESKFIARNCFKIIHTTLAVGILSVVGLFIYEQKYLRFEDYLDTYAVIPSEVEFDQNQPISFFLFASNEKYTNIFLRQELMCDYFSGDGFHNVSSQVSQIGIGPEVSSRELSHEEYNPTQYVHSVDEINELVKNSNIAEFIVYNGESPEAESKCFVKFKFVKYTDNFNIAKEFETLSYPFRYSETFLPASTEVKSKPR